MVTKVTFVGDNFTRKAPKFERFIRPTGLRFKKAHVTHPELQVGVCVCVCVFICVMVTFSHVIQNVSTKWSDSTHTHTHTHTHTNTGDLLPGHSGGKEEPFLAHVHHIGCDYEGDSD